MVSPTQTIMFTAMARGIAADKPTLPVSVLVSPRLTGAPTLDAFPDWLCWTNHLKDDGLKITFAANGDSHTATIDPRPLRPELWDAIFDKNTHVDDYSFDDYGQRLVVSYPTRATLTLLKSIFQVGGLQLALPGEVNDENQGKRRALLQLIDGLAVHWNYDRAREWRNALLQRQRLQLRAPARTRRQASSTGFGSYPAHRRRFPPANSGATACRTPPDCRRPAAPRRKACAKNSPHNSRSIIISRNRRRSSLLISTG
jgi:hypothetical protein